MKSKRWLAAAMSVGAMLWGKPAAAERPATASSVQVGLGFVYGHSLEDEELNPWGPGLGVHGGYTLENALYLGGTFDYFFGEEIELFGGTASSNIWQLMGEAGYDIGLGRNLVLRPKAGLGVASWSVEACLPGFACADESESDFALAPGAAFMVFTSSVSFALDVRYDLVFADETAEALLFRFGIGF